VEAPPTAVASRRAVAYRPHLSCAWAPSANDPPSPRGWVCCDDARWPLDQLAAAASATGRLSGLPGGLEPGTDLFGLLDILVGGAPEEQASGNFSDRHRYVEYCGDTENAILQGGGARPFRDRHASRAVAQRLELLVEGVIKLRVHPGAAAYPTGFCQGDVFKLDRGGRFGHGISLSTEKESPRRHGPGHE
jgi:hypothetical protein